MKRFALLLAVLLILPVLYLACSGLNHAPEMPPCKVLSYPAPIPFDLVSNKPYLKVRVNGSEPLWFVLDTGSAGGSILEWEQARKIGLEIKNVKKRHAGAGEGVLVRMGHAAGLTFDLYGLKIPNQSAAVVDLGHVCHYDGHQFDGTFGYNLFMRFVVEIDYAEKFMYLHEPADYVYGGRGRSIPISFLGGLVIVAAEITLPDGKTIKDNFVVDTGARTAILFNSPFVKKHELLKSLPKSFEATVGGGVGGESKGHIGRIKSLKLGPFLLKEPVAAFSSDKSGVLASSSFAGIIGAEALKRCRVIFDYRRKCMILEPRKGAPKTYEYDMSGMFLIGKGPDYNRFKVQSVVKDSPAGDAGIQKGDIIITVNGRAASELTLEKLRTLFLKEGKEYKLELQRGEEKLEVEFKTRKLI